ncbi:right-handed parallel beta-helix repeat-containing protein [Chitinophaga sp. MM2321]|uniref:right-handed parallel beta-helix repeat-containing protein n=1 Tax=Chitinophaga sp. MM2321 TaxID=3137178 RepID=UPI0032D5B11C
MINKSIICLWLLLLPVLVMAQQKILVSDFGIQPNTFVDATPAVQKAIEACRNKPGAILEFPAGRYDFYPEHAVKKKYFISNTSSETEVSEHTKTIGLFFEAHKDLTIEGNGAEFVFHGKMITWVFDSCENITLRHVSMNFEHPTMAEMSIKTVTPQYVIATIQPDSRFTIQQNRLEWYGNGWRMKIFHAVLADTARGVNTYSSWTPFYNSRAELIAPYMVKFTGDFSRFKAAPGNVLTVRDGIRDEVGAFIRHSKNIHLDSVTMHYMHGLGIVAQFSENLYYDHVQVVPKENSGRVMASFADGMHFSGCKGEIKVEHSHFKGLHDDPINIHGTQLKVTEVVSPRVLKLRFMHPQTYGFAAFFAGDSIAFLHAASLQLFGNGMIKSATLISEREMEVTLTTDKPAALKAGDCLENITWTPSVAIRNCRFESVNTRGLLVTTRKKVVIENNTFYRTGMHAILIADDASSWYESGPVADVLITGNTFEECGYNQAPGNYVIAIAPENHELVKGYMVHRNIRIENNTFKIYDYPVLTARSTDNLVFTGNHISWTDNFMKPQGPVRASFNLTACSRVQLLKNDFNTPFRPTVSLHNMAAKALKTDLPVLPAR